MTIPEEGPFDAPLSARPATYRSGSHLLDGNLASSPQPVTPQSAGSNVAASPIHDPKLAAFKARASAPVTSNFHRFSDPVSARDPESPEEEPTLAERRGASLDVTKLAELEESMQGLSVDKLQAGRERSAEEEQEQLGGTSQPAEMDRDGVWRKDTILSPNERNARLESLDAVDGEKSPSPPPKHGSGSSVLERSKPFKVEWIKVRLAVADFAHFWLTSLR